MKITKHAYINKTNYNYSTNEKAAKEHICCFCKKPYKQYSAHKDYSIGNNKLCSYTCRQRFWKKLTLKQKDKYMTKIRSN